VEQPQLVKAMLVVLLVQDFIMLAVVAALVQLVLALLVLQDLARLVVLARAVTLT
jgi:hypothetical protein